MTVEQNGKLRRRFGLAARIIGIPLLVGGAVLVAWAWSTLPRTSGEATLAGLAGEVEIFRDAHGVPHIFAGSADDAYFALGYVHAQDRLWQMEFTRRLGAGRLAEVTGEAGLGADRFLRTLGLYRQAEIAAARLSPTYNFTMYQTVPTATTKNTRNIAKTPHWGRVGTDAGSNVSPRTINRST